MTPPTMLETLTDLCISGCVLYTLISVGSFIGWRRPNRKLGPREDELAARRELRAAFATGEPSTKGTFTEVANTPPSRDFGERRHPDARQSRAFPPLRAVPNEDNSVA